MATTWSREEILKLIEVWGEDSVQAQLNGCKRNQEVFVKVSTTLLEAGYNKTASQCIDKIKKLKGEYRKVKDKRGKTGEGRYPEWDYFDALDAILGHSSATKPPLVVNNISAIDKVLHRQIFLIMIHHAQVRQLTLNVVQHLQVQLVIQRWLVQKNKR